MLGGGMRVPYHPGMAYWGEIASLRENTERRDFSRLWRKAGQGTQADRDFDKLRERLVENGFTQYADQEGGAALLTDLQRMLRGERVMPDFQVGEERGIYGEGDSRGDAEARRELGDVQPATLDQAYAAIKALSGKPLKNLETGIVGRINRVQRDKLTSPAARDKSQKNGFSAEQHLGAAAKVEQLWRHATLVDERPDADGDKNISSIKRFAAPLFIGDTPAVAWLTAKESVEAGHRVYSIELQEIEMLRGKLKALAENGQRLPARSIEERIAQLFRKVKSDFRLEEVQTEFAFPQTSNAPITDPVERTQWDVGKEGREVLAGKIAALTNEPGALDAYGSKAGDVGHRVGRELQEKGSAEATQRNIDRFRKNPNEDMMRRLIEDRDKLDENELRLQRDADQRRSLQVGR